MEKDAREDGKEERGGREGEGTQAPNCLNTVYPHTLPPLPAVTFPPVSGDEHSSDTSCLLGACCLSRQGERTKKGAII